MNIDKQIEFDKVKNIWAELASTDYAKEKIQEIELCFSENELKKELRDTTDAKELIEKVGTPPLQNITEIRDVLMIVEKGDCLTPYQLQCQMGSLTGAVASKRVTEAYKGRLSADGNRAMSINV